MAAKNNVIVLNSSDENEGSDEDFVPAQQRSVRRGRRGRRGRGGNTSRGGGRRGRRGSKRSTRGDSSDPPVTESLSVLDDSSNSSFGVGTSAHRRIPDIDDALFSSLDNDLSSEEPPVKATTKRGLAKKKFPQTSQEESSKDLVQSVSPVPKKSTKRGLAKKGSNLGFIDSLTDVHNIYSQHVSVFKKIAEDINQCYSKSDEKEDSSTAGLVEEYIPAQPSGVTNDLETNASLEEALLSEEGEDSEDSNDAESFRSPTPPPQLATPVSGRRGRRKGMNHKLTSALNALSNAKKKLDSTTPSSRRGRRSRNSDVMIVEDESPVKTELSVKVRYLQCVHRVSIQLSDKLRCLVSQLSEVLSEPEHTLSLFLNEQPLNLSTTARKAGLTVADIIECYCMKSLSSSAGPEDCILVYVQCQDRRTRTAVSAPKRQPLMAVMQKFAGDLSVDPSSLQLTFDGEEVSASDTPERLEMEEGDVIDIIVS